MMCAVSGQRSGLSKSLIHMTSALVFLEGSASPQPLVNDLEACGVQVLAVLDAGSKLVQGVVRHAPDLVIGEVPQSGDALFETTQTLASVAPCPVIVFTHDGDAAHIERAVASGVHAWVVNGYGAQRLRPLMQLAQARFKREQALLEELRDVSTRFEERKAVERAKGILMSARQVSDDAAFEILRTASMHSNQRLGQVAQHIIQSAHFAEGVNRAGQLRMLSQRLVKHWLLRLAGVQAARHLTLQTESAQRIDANLALFRAKYGDDIPVDLHGEIRSREACMKSTQLALSLARRHDAQLHVLHISTAEELQLFDPGPVEGKRITAETCVHFLRFARPDYAERGNFIKCNPSIKEPSDRAALLRAIADDRIDVLATDHAPHTLEEKEKPYVQAPSGLPLVQYALVAALELVHEGRMDVARVVQKFAHAPAQLFDVKERGYLREGYFADLVLIDDEPLTVKREDVLSKVGWSPFEGRTFRSRIGATWVNGRMVWNGEHLVGTPNGQRLEFAR